MAEELFCNKSLKPWLIALSVLTVIFVVWGTLDREELFPHRGHPGDQGITGGHAMSPGTGEPVIPLRSIQTVAMTNPYSLEGQNAMNGSVSQNALPVTPDSSYNLAAITKATPNGGVQLVADPQFGGFQYALKRSVNAVLPTVCDIHAIWIRRTDQGRRFANAQENLQFMPPFDGNIEKFIQNQGFENIGSGIIIDDQGYVITNYHVVKDASNILVTVPGNPSIDYTARTVASDPTKDLSLLKLDTADVFKEAKLGDSSFCQVGDYVISIGSPFGMEQTVTSGIISGIRKSVLVGGVEFMNLIQTDAPINRGSSGGPLVNMNGEVIGITTAIYAPTGVFNGTGFVIPINDAKEFLATVLDRDFAIPVDPRGMFQQPVAMTPAALNRPVPIHFGIEAIPLDAQIAQRLGSTAFGGVLVNRVLENSPASFAGIERGDVITSIGGVPIRSLADVAATVSHFNAGDKANMTIVRNGKKSELLVKLW